MTHEDAILIFRGLHEIDKSILLWGFLIVLNLAIRNILGGSK